jgi:hypothetical protein
MGWGNGILVRTSDAWTDTDTVKTRLRAAAQVNKCIRRGVFAGVEVLLIKCLLIVQSIKKIGYGSTTTDITM